MTTKKTSRPTKKPTAKPATKAAQKKPQSTKGDDKRLSAIDAAAKLLADTKESMTCTEMIEAMAVKKLWSSPNGKTPQATLYSAILREIKNKGADARFKKIERGKFATSG